MRKEFITRNSKETQKLGEMLAKEFKNGGVLALSGDLGSGKTTFTQGFLKELKVKGPYTSPTFLVIRCYRVAQNAKPACWTGRRKTQKMFHAPRSTLCNIYHIDAYRIKSKDILDLGWEEIVSIPENIVIIEWADRIKKIVPKSALWIKFEWVDNNTRKLKLYEDKDK